MGSSEWNLTNSFACLNDLPAPSSMMASRSMGGSVKSICFKSSPLTRFTSSLSSETVLRSFSTTRMRLLPRITLSRSSKLRFRYFARSTLPFAFFSAYSSLRSPMGSSIRGIIEVFSMVSLEYTISLSSLSFPAS